MHRETPTTSTTGSFPEAAQAPGGPTPADLEGVPALWAHAYSSKPGWRRACARFLVQLLDDRWPTVPPLF